MRFLSVSETAVLAPIHENQGHFTIPWGALTKMLSQAPADGQAPRPTSCARSAIPRASRSQLHRLAARARGARLARLVQDGLRLRRMLEEPRRTSVLVARALADGSFSPARGDDAPGAARRPRAAAGVAGRRWIWSCTR